MGGPPSLPAQTKNLFPFSPRTGILPIIAKRKRRETMGRELYVGNIADDATENDLRRLFAVAGKVSSIHLITDPVSGKFKGCGYVKMATDDEAKDAVASLDGALFMSRLLRVNEARPQKEKERKPVADRGKARRDSASRRRGK